MLYFPEDANGGDLSLCITRQDICSHVYIRGSNLKKRQRIDEMKSLNVAESTVWPAGRLSKCQQGGLTRTVTDQTVH